MFKSLSSHIRVVATVFLLLTGIAGGAVTDGFSIRRESYLEPYRAPFDPAVPFPLVSITLPLT